MDESGQSNNGLEDSPPEGKWSPASYLFEHKETGLRVKIEAYDFSTDRYYRRIGWRTTGGQTVVPTDMDDNFCKTIYVLTDVGPVMFTQIERLA